MAFFNEVRENMGQFCVRTIDLSTTCDQKSTQLIRKTSTDRYPQVQEMITQRVPIPCQNASQNQRHMYTRTEYPEDLKDDPNYKPLKYPLVKDIVFVLSR